MAWYASWFHLDDANGNEDIDDGGEANHTPREMAISELPRQAHSERQRSWMDTETTHAYDAPIGTRTASENHWRDVEPVKLPSLLAQKHIRVLLLIEALFSFVFTGFNEIYSLWALSTVARGGLDWSSVQIGKIFLASGFLVLVFEMFAVPNITPRVGFKMSQRLGSIFEIPVYVLLPLLSNLNAGGTFVTATSIILVFMCYVSANSFYVGVALAFNNATVPERRGELNGISSGVASFSKAIAPIFCATLFAYSIDGDRFFPFDYHCAFYFIGAMRLGAAYMGWNRIRNEVTVEKFDIELIGLNWISDTEAAKVHDTDCIGLSRKNATELVENVPANPVEPNNRNDTRVVDMFGME